MKATEVLYLTFNKTTDPDLDDSAIQFVDFGAASSFITGKFPNYLIKPISNDTDIGVYPISVNLTDNNPNPLSSITSFTITVDPLPPSKVIVFIPPAVKKIKPILIPS